MTFEDIKKNTRFLQYIAACWVAFLLETVFVREVRSPFFANVHFCFMKYPKYVTQHIFCVFNIQVNTLLLFVLIDPVGTLQLSLWANMIWGSPTLPLLLSENSPIGQPLTFEEASWVMSCLNLSMIPGGVLLAILFDKVGPKYILLIGAISTVICWIVLGTAKSFASLIIGRSIAGLGDGITYSCINIYLSEIGSKDIRGKLAVVPALGGTLAVILMYSIGPYLQYTTLITCAAIFPIVFIVCFPFMPDSPYFLIRRGRREDAENSLRKLSSLATTPSEVEVMLKEVEGTVRRDSRDLKLCQLLLQPNFRKSLFIVTVAQVIAVLCGTAFISPYLQVILKSGRLGLSPELTSALYGLVQIPSLLLSGFLVDRFGRKPLYCISSLGAGLALTLEGTYLYMQELYDLQSIAIMPVLFLIAYQVSIYLGLTYLPNLLVGELFTTRTKKIGSPLAMCFSSFVAFGSVKICGTLFESWGMYTLFWIFGGFCVLGILFGLYVLPETKGKSFEEIQDSLLSTKNAVNGERLELKPCHSIIIT